MIFVCDTCTVYNDLLLQNPLFEVIYFYGEDMGIKIVFPEIVIQEMLRHHRERTEALYKQLESTVDEINRLQFATVKYNDPRNDTFLYRDDWYEEHLFRQIDRLGWYIPLDEVSTKQLVERCQARRSPFHSKKNTKDDGFKDAILWESVLWLLRSFLEEDITLISRDEKFFANKGKKGESKESQQLHQHLQEEVDAIDATNRFHITRDLDRILDSVVWGSLERDYEAERLWLNSETAPFNLPTFLQSYQFCNMFIDVFPDPEICGLKMDEVEAVKLYHFDYEDISELKVFVLKNKKRMAVFRTEGPCILSWRQRIDTSPKAIWMDKATNTMHVKPASYSIPLSEEEPRFCRIQVYVTVEDGADHWQSLETRLLECIKPESDL